MSLADPTALAFDKFTAHLEYMSYSKYLNLNLNLNSNLNLNLNLNLKLEFEFLK